MDQRGIILPSLHLLTLGLKLLELEPLTHTEHITLLRILQLEPRLLVIFLSPVSPTLTLHPNLEHLQSSHETSSELDY